MRRAVIVLIFVLLLLPLWFMIIGSMQDLYNVFIMPPRLIPLHPTMMNYQWIFSLDMTAYAANTVLLLFSVVIISVAVSACTGYAFAFFEFKFKEALWVVVLLALMIPRMSMIVPLFVVIRKLGISGTLLAAALPTAYMPISIYIARLYFQTIPKSLLESARIDGATEIGVLSRVVAPVSRPIITACALFASIAALNDYLWQMLQLQRPDKQTMLVGLIKESMKRGGGIDLVNPIGRSFAVGIVLFLPMFLIFLVANRYFTSAIGGAVKG